ncbi:hypothetical protein RQP46_001641 [Phenoliferia psychrophenolica]
MAGSAPPSSTATGKKQPLKNRSISDFFSSIPSPASSRGTNSSSPAPLARTLPPPPPPMSLTRGGSAPSLPIAPQQPKPKSKMGSTQSTAAPKAKPASAPAAAAAPVASAVASTSQVKAATRVAMETDDDSDDAVRLQVQPPSSVHRSGKGKKRAPVIRDEDPSDSEIEVLAFVRKPSPSVPPPGDDSEDVEIFVKPPQPKQAAAAPPTPAPEPQPEPSDAMDLDSVPDAPSSSQAVSSILFARTSSPPPPSLPALRPASPSYTASTSLPIPLSPPKPSPFSALSSPPRSGPIYTRSPSGSPLSSLDGSPPKPRAMFVGVQIELDASKRLPRNLGGRVGTIRRERSVTAAELDSDVDNTSLAGPSSPTPIAKMEEDDEDHHMGLVGGDFGSNEGSDEDNGNDNDTVVTDSDEESDGEGLLAVLAASKAKVLAAKANGVPIPAPAASSSALLRSPDVRKSSRALLPPRKIDDVKPVLAGSSVNRGGKLGMAALQKDHEARQRKAIAQAETERLLATSTHLDDDSDSDSYTEQANGPLTADRIEALGRAVQDVAAEDEYARSPEKKAASAQAALVVSLLKDESGRNTKDATPTLGEDEELRTAWREVLMAPYVPPEDEGGWKGKVAKAIREGVRDPESFPLALQLFSPVAGRGSPADQTEVSRWLLSLLSHPSTPALVAERAQQLLTRLIAHRALSTTTSNSSPLLTAQHFFDVFERLGVKADLVDKPQLKLIRMDLDSTDDDHHHHGSSNGTPVSVEERSESVQRTLRVVQALAGAQPRLLSNTDVSTLSIFLVRLAVDPTSASQRSTLERTLHALLSTVSVTDNHLRSEMLESLYTTFRFASIRTRLEVVEAIPHATKACKLLRKWLAWALLTDRPVSTSFEQTSNLPPPLEAIADFIGEAEVFVVTPDMDDVALLHNTLLLTLVLTDLGDEMYQSNKVAGRASARQVVLVAQALHKLDSSIRVDIKKGSPARNKAKNVVMRLEHLLHYQTLGVLPVDKAPLPNGDDDEGGEDGQKKRQRLDQGQTTLSFAPVARLAPAPAPAPLTRDNLATLG